MSLQALTADQGMGRLYYEQLVLHAHFIVLLQYVKRVLESILFFFCEVGFSLFYLEKVEIYETFAAGGKVDFS